MARAGNPVEKADRPTAEHTKSNQWSDRRVWRAQEGDGKEPLKYFRGVAQEGKLELNGKPELCMEVCLHRQEEMFGGKSGVGPEALGMEECSCWEPHNDQKC